MKNRGNKKNSTVSKLEQFYKNKDDIAAELLHQKSLTRLREKNEQLNKQAQMLQTQLSSVGSAFASFGVSTRDLAQTFTSIAQTF